MFATLSSISLDAVMQYANPAVVARFVDKLGLDEAAASLLFDDTKRFLYLCATKRKGDPFLAPTKKVDAGWHEFILFTEDYASFCQNFLGRFIHHRPSRKEDAYDGARALRFTKAFAASTFGALSDNWKIRPTERNQCVDCDGGGCNEPECHVDDPVQ